MPPSTFLNLNLDITNDIMNPRRNKTNKATEHIPIPLALTLIPLPRTRLPINHGNGNLKVHLN